MRRFRLQFGLKTLFLIAAMIALKAAWYVHYAEYYSQVSKDNAQLNALRTKIVQEMQTVGWIPRLDADSTGSNSFRSWKDWYLSLWFNYATSNTYRSLDVTYHFKTNMTPLNLSNPAMEISHFPEIESVSITLIPDGTECGGPAVKHLDPPQLTLSKEDLRKILQLPHLKELRFSNPALFDGWAELIPADNQLEWIGLRGSVDNAAELAIKLRNKCPKLKSLQLP